MRESYDVIVAGAGPAGVMAAIAAGRKGAAVLLIERANCSGGIWTSGLLSWMLDVTNKGGIIREMMLHIEAQGNGYFAKHGNFITFPETVKLELDDLLETAGVDVLYYTTVTGAHVSNRKIDSIETISKAGKAVFTAKQYIDATGDGDLSAFAGCQFDLGRPGDGALQPGSLIALMTGVNEEAVREYNNTLPVTGGKNAKERMLEKMNEMGLKPSYRAPSFFHIAENIWLMMTTHAYGVNPLSPESLTKGTIENRRELHQQEQAFRSLQGAWKNMRIVATAPYLGIREGRRVKGKYTVTREDMLNGKRHEDTVCCVEFGLDIHALTENSDNSAPQALMKARPYDIPLRALESADIDNLLLAGRLISGDFYAHSSYRVTGDAAAIGEAAGNEAARRTADMK